MELYMAGPPIQGNPPSWLIGPDRNGPWCFASPGGLYGEGLRITSLIAKRNGHIDSNIGKIDFHSGTVLTWGTPISIDAFSLS
jgi:hypothetical protein